MTEKELMRICDEEQCCYRWATRKGSSHRYLYVARRGDGGRRGRVWDAYVCSSRRFEELTEEELQKRIRGLPSNARVRQEAQRHPTR
jgi:hypothetical protein